MNKQVSGLVKSVVVALIAGYIAEYIRKKVSEAEKIKQI